MRILVTGGLGFIGGRLAIDLAALGHEVILTTRKKYSSTVDWLPSAQVIIAKWSNSTALNSLCKNVDVVIHAAGMNAAQCERNPIEANSFNGMTTARLLMSACNMGVKKFIYLSTAHVYSNLLSGEIDESLIPSNMHPYATSHLMGENAVLNIAKQDQIHGTVIRMSNVFGAPAHEKVNCWHLLINDLCRQAVENKALRIRSHQFIERDFIAMQDLCSSVSTLSNIKNMNNNGEVYNVGSGKVRTLSEVADLIQSRCICTLGFKPSINYINNEFKGSHPKLNFSIAKIIKAKYKEKVDNSINEIDNLLNYCNKVFNK